MIEIGALWKKQTKDGVTYLKGALNQNTDILILQNKYKKADNQPDYRIFFAEKNKEAQKGAPAKTPQVPLPSYEEAVGRPFPTQTKLGPSEDEFDVSPF